MNSEPTSPVCSYCQSPIADTDSRAVCPECGAGYHAECWQENGGCAVYGCRQTPVTAARTAMEVPVSWWGQQNKPCPACGREILAAALRCRHCGATFASARPEDRDEFERRTQIAGEHPGLRTRVIVMFVLSIVPLSAPAGVAMGLVWYWPNRDKVETLSSIHPALARLGLIAGFIQTAAFIVLGVVYSALN